MHELLHLELARMRAEDLRQQPAHRGGVGSAPRPLQWSGYPRG
jgi:hypothetical protein